MNDEQFEAERQRIIGLLDVWIPILGLDAWDISREFMDGPYVRGDGKPSGEAVATAFVRWHYQHATLSFNCRETAAMSLPRLEAVIVHEGCHVLLNELRPDDGLSRDWLEHEEHAATMLAWAFLRARGSEPVAISPDEADE